MFLFAALQSSLAQRTDWGGPWGVGAGLGTTSYIGDLNEHNANRFIIMPQSLSFAGKGWFSKGFGPLTLIIQMDLGRLQSRDYRKDLKFRGSFYNYGAHVKVNMNKLLLGRKYRMEKWHFFLQGGVSMMRYSSYLTDIPNDTLYSEVGYAAIGKSLALVGGMGIEYKITDEVNFQILVEYNKLNMDDIDALIKGSSNDNYILMSMGVSYTFGNVYVSGGRRRSLLWGKY
ncbi:MAG: hypothetical protein B7C24_12945 [Bacteroidetes bacterium 4572_77]|nr:MAG: hypothetical protein B7C24_12945 [Bacteroidetes bacterium 4572_77]